MYRKPVQFDRQATSAHGQPWLDMWVSFRGGALEIHMDGQEQEWVQCQASKPPAKIRLKPYVMGDVAESLDALRLHVSGRIARLRQAGLDDVALHKAVQREILVRIRFARLSTGDDASGLVQVPPVPGGC